MGGKSDKYKESWTLERRRKQRERILKTQPWLKSTGPTSSDGKKVSSQNARNKYASLSQVEIMKLLRKQLNLLKKIENLDFSDDEKELIEKLTGVNTQ